jgi:hypothetical protein
MYALIGVISLFVWAGILTLDVPTIMSRFSVDDTFYYLEIAKNIALGKGATFDGIHHTNGFQPLFQLLLVPIFWITTDPVSGLYILKGIEALFLSMASVLLFRLAWKISGNVSSAWFGLMLFHVPGPSGLPLSKDLIIGMESGINALMILLMLNFMLDIWMIQKVPRQRYIYYGVVIGLAFLARLDAIFLITGIACLHCFEIYKSNERTVLFQNLIWAGSMSLLIAGAYLIQNQILYGHPEPISGRILSWNSAELSAKLWGQGVLPWLGNVVWFLTKGRSVGRLALAGILLVPVILFLHRFNVIGKNREPIILPEYVPLLGVIWAASIVKIFYYAVFLQFPIAARFWYYVLESIIFALCGGILISFFLQNINQQKLARWAPVFAISIMLFTALSINQAKPVREWEYVSYNELQNISKITGTDAVIGVKDAGVLGYFLPNPVVNLDGLVND